MPIAMTHEGYLFINLAAQRFDLPASGFAVQALSFSGETGATGLTFFGNGDRPPNQFLQPPQSLLPVLLLAAMFLRLDHHYPVFGDALVANLQEPFFVKIWQRGGFDVEAEMNGGCHFVDVLTACTLRSDGSGFDFMIGDGDSF